MNEPLKLKAEEPPEEVQPHREKVWTQKGWWVLGLGLLGVVLAAWSWNSVDRRFSPREATTMASVISLKEDGDLRFAANDEKRWQRTFGRTATLPVLQDGELKASPLYVALLRGLGGQARSAIRLNSILLTLLVGFSAWGLYRLWGSQTSWILLALVVLSPLVFAVFRIGEELFLAVLAVLGMLLLTSRKGWVPEAIPQIFEGELNETRGQAEWRAGIAVVLLAIIGGHRPVLLPLFMGYLVQEQPRSKSWTVPLLTALTLGLGFWIQGAAAVQAWIEAIPSTFQSSLVYLNPLYAAVGPRVGWLWTFPLVLLMWPSKGYRALGWGMVGTYLMATWTRPWDFAGPEVWHGNLLLLVVYPSLWWFFKREIKGSTMVWGAILSLLVLGPLWLNIKDFTGPPSWYLNRFSPARFLPYETSLDLGPNEGEVILGQVRVRGRYKNLIPLANGSLLWDMAQPASLHLESPRALRRVGIDFDEEAPSKMEVRGGELEQTVFRPNGGIGLLIQPERPRIHPSRDGNLDHYFYRVEIETSDTRDRVPMYFSVEYSNVMVEPE